MSRSQPREFSIDATAIPEPVPTLAEELAGEVRDSHAERTVWLDTHDWLLHGAGLRLEQQTAPGGPWLVLTDDDGREVRQPGPKTTVTAATLPNGAIADRVRPVVGIRELLPQATASGPVDVIAVLDDLDKTVARVVVQGPLAVEGGAVLPIRARVETLRGYEKEAKRAGRRLKAIKGVGRAGPRHEAVWAAAGLDPDAHRSKPELDFDAEMTAGEAYAETFAQLLAILRDNVDGTLAQLDTEFLHDFRVTVRRSRAVLKSAGDVFEREVAARWAAELKWLGDATSASRDLDVYLLDYDELAGRVSDPASLDPFRDRLVRQCRSAHTRLNRALRSQRFADLLDAWQRELAAPPAGPLADTPVPVIANQRLAKAWRRVHKRGRAITDDSPAEALHDLRKRCKELRYLLELFASLHEPATHKALVKALKRLQDNLGSFQDFEAQRFFVVDHAEALAKKGAPAATLMSMGRLEQQLEAGQDGARDEFAERWAEFDTAENQKLYDGLVAE